MARYRVRERNIRLWGSHSDGSEFLHDFATLAEARAAVPSDAIDWTIFELDNPDVAGVRGAVLASGPSKRRTATKRKRSSTSRSKSGRAKKSRTLTRLRRVRVATKRRGYGVMRHGLSARSYGTTPKETFVAVATGHSGNRLGQWSSKTVSGAMTQADQGSKSGTVTIRGEMTSDGTYWGPGRGRVVAVRENGRWMQG